MFTQIPEGTQYYIRVHHRFVRRYEIAIRLTDRCSINFIANVLHLSNKIPTDIVRDYGLVKVLGKQGFILHTQKLFRSIKQLPLISTVFNHKLRVEVPPSLIHLIARGGAL